MRDDCKLCEQSQNLLLKSYEKETHTIVMSHYNFPSTPHPPQYSKQVKYRTHLLSCMHLDDIHLRSKHFAIKVSIFVVVVCNQSVKLFRVIGIGGT